MQTAQRSAGRNEWTANERQTATSTLKELNVVRGQKIRVTGSVRQSRSKLRVHGVGRDEKISCIPELRMHDPIGQFRRSLRDGGIADAVDVLLRQIVSSPDLRRRLAMHELRAVRSRLDGESLLQAILTEATRSPQDAEARWVAFASNWLLQRYSAAADAASQILESEDPQPGTEVLLLYDALCSDGRLQEAERILPHPTNLVNQYIQAYKATGRHSVLQDLVTAVSAMLIRYSEVLGKDDVGGELMKRSRDEIRRSLCEANLEHVAIQIDEALSRRQRP